ncbi:MULTISPECIES: DUF3927 family protein [Enterobacter cloacae complex]|uniref:DUF3927 family protein n=1 Tax=Enterobacter cloacae complex TaxID=354276 RepID=UPI0018C2D503|nr:DUF3927 family protein [Enterobacter roggenkampii]HCT9401753.1 DUF3927 family protein [Enterobacter hormaechei]MBG0658279.1 DUF3927 family protein [Enterobacter roggenkampii]MCK6912428.1 DUF3927 family protein [Enterobacter roggenkampii]MCM7329147.1 DUF3927 family protein [Enterobacter roggenkampii]MDV0447979.1 DUF3927 family protein [Enterobacter roggenkampii]
MGGMSDALRIALVLLLAFMSVVTDFTSYILSFVSDAFFVGALVWLIWPKLKQEK